MGILKEGVVLVQGIMISISYKFQNRGSEWARKLPKASVFTQRRSKSEFPVSWSG